MKLREIMSTPVMRIHPDENVMVAARTMEHYNIGAMPVCGSDGRLQGMITDRDIVFSVLGYGHRVGMSQYGANAMADAGKTYKEILCHYYSDVEIKNIRE